MSEVTEGIGTTVHALSGPQWQFCLNGEWNNSIVFCLPYNTPGPSRPHRWLQRWLLGIHWRQVTA